ncbi:archaetidylserine decarboxylase [Aurantiacibacter gangjinensis]|uniref:Phosphatidylserine decarboxylase proenzyme n=1 Tax=Aurantiacibacter gangjinensis TaxID=502682 RepID=A0A0G9MKZ2_9SPHN|nr:archaetidylserine decarboxylase [Aurantiacibacter gangjinensis]APE27292.1 Phosphatidylserine decarboxylase [Aurantiacibacter gangjinensis]KLE31401.1 phosphatidylserine decarboxylase [Aurantiacibacter gangjinensis]
MSKPFIAFQKIVPHHAVSRFAGRFAGSQKPWLKDRLIRRFIASYDVDMSEAARPIEAYASFNDFFMRELKPGARPLADARDNVLSPADGAISQIGRIEDGRIFQAKGRHFTAAQLLGGDDAAAARFAGGHFATIYLSPKDYHRVHMPADGDLQSTVYVPGDLFSVNTVTAENVDGLFARNERLACQFDGGAHGQFASVMVGAMIVAGIETVWQGRTETHHPEVIRRDFADGERTLAAGAEMGRFFLGSTVVLLFEPGKLTWDGSLKAGDSVRMGQSLGRWAG